MNHILKAFLALVVLPLFGCNLDNNPSDPLDTGEQQDSIVQLERIDIVASPITTLGVSEMTLAKGNTQSFEAIGHYSDGSSKPLTNLSMSNWHTSDENVGHFEKPGVLMGGEMGATTVTASKNGITSNSMDVTVTAATITAIQVTPPSINIAKGQTEQLTAMATYSDDTSVDISDLVIWTLEDSKIATVTASGSLSGVKKGTTTVIATKGNITSNTIDITVSAAIITTIQVTPSSVNIAKGQTKQLTATATYSDNSQSNISDSVSWISTDPNTATVDASGLLTGANVGKTAVTATKDNVTSNTVDVEVMDKVITDIHITPEKVNVAKGQTKRLTAIATYSDGTSSPITSSISWSSADTNTATVLSGSLSGVKEGTTSITAIIAETDTQHKVISNTVNVEVTAAIIKTIQVTPQIVKVAKGQAEQLKAMATYSDNTQSNISDSVSWISADPNTATVLSGSLSGVEQGTTTVIATKDSVTSNTVDVEVMDKVITDIHITPEKVNVAKGQTKRLTAIATYSDGTSSPITSSISWSSADTNTATVLSGSIYGVKEGTTNITATISATDTQHEVTSNTATVEVTAKVISKIKVSPKSINVAKGQTQQLKAMAAYSDGTSSPLTSSVIWTSTDPNIATVDQSGSLSGVDTGTTSVTVTQGNVSSKPVTVNVSAAVITKIEVTPKAVNIAKDQTKQLTAMATYSDGTFSPITSSVAWIWSPIDSDVATVTESGELFGAKVGTTSITASKYGITSNTVAVKITDKMITKIEVSPSSPSLPNGETQQLAAKAYYDDGSLPEDVTNSASWHSDNPSAAIVVKGLIHTKGIGIATITATKGNQTSNQVTVDVTAAAMTKINVTPPPEGVLPGQSTQLKAIAIYSDGTSSSVTDLEWKSTNTTVAAVWPDGWLTSYMAGTTEVTATKDDVTSDPATITVCEDLAGECIDTFYTGAGKLFTNSPSVAYLNNIGDNDATNGSYEEDGTDGPKGSFYLFNWDNANTLCDTYNSKNIRGRTNWRLAEDEELTQLVTDHGNMFEERGWPTGYLYWSKTGGFGSYHAVSLIYGNETSISPIFSFYASCVSDPE